MDCPHHLPREDTKLGYFSFFYICMWKILMERGDSFWNTCFHLFSCMSLLVVWHPLTVCGCVYVLISKVLYCPILVCTVSMFVIWKIPQANGVLCLHVCVHRKCLALWDGRVHNISNIVHVNNDPLNVCFWQSILMFTAVWSNNYTC